MLGGVQTINRDTGSIKPSTVREEGGRTKITDILEMMFAVLGKLFALSFDSKS